MLSIWYRILRVIIHIVRVCILLTYDVRGEENIPACPPYMVVANHMSVIDTPLIFLSIRYNKWSSFAGEKWARHPLFGPILRWSGAIFVNRGEVDRQALEGAMAKIKDGFIFGLAVEGTRSRTFQLQRGKDGAAYLALKAGVPLVPLGLVDTEKWHPNYKKFRPTHITSHIGPAFELPDLGRRVRSKDLPAYTHFIMVHIANQLPERYHGYYADSPALAALRRGEDPWPHCLAAEGVAA